MSYISTDYCLFSFFSTKGDSVVMDLSVNVGGSKGSDVMLTVVHTSDWHGCRSDKNFYKLFNVQFNTGFVNPEATKVCFPK